MCRAVGKVGGTEAGGREKSTNDGSGRSGKVETERHRQTERQSAEHVQKQRDRQAEGENEVRQVTTKTEFQNNKIQEKKKLVFKNLNFDLS